MNLRSIWPGSAFTAAVAAVALAACDERPTTAPDTSAAVSHGTHDVVTDPEVTRWLAGLRHATAKLHDIDAAAAAGWSARITECMELPGTGAMGFHYANTGLIDAVPQEFAPELLVYEPQKNGRLRLVAVEYIVPFDAWTDAEPPALHGVAFHRNEAFGLWVLHAWVWKHNPTGIFQDWNPEATCAFAR